MSNERLRGAILAGSAVDPSSRRYTGVDPKTVTRWLGGRVPHPRHRFAVAAFLAQDEEYLWPSANRSELNSDAATAELVAAFPFRADVDAAYWWTMITRHGSRSTCWATRSYFLPQQHPWAVSVSSRSAPPAAASGLVLADPESELVRLREVEEQEPITLSARI